MKDLPNSHPEASTGLVANGTTEVDFDVEPKASAELVVVEDKTDIDLVLTAEPTWRRICVSDPDALVAATAAVKAGQSIVLPTDTVYGIAADAFSRVAVQGLLDAKQRGWDMPPPVLIAEPGMLRALTTDVPNAALELSKHFWPGALTLILVAQHTLNLKIGETGGTVAVRVPDQDWTRALLRRTGPLAVSSANRSGEQATTNIDEAINQLGNAVSIYLDAGVSAGGIGSTIIDFTRGEDGYVVREGAISFEQLVEVVPNLIPIGYHVDDSAEPTLQLQSESSIELMDSSDTELTAETSDTT